MHVTICNVYVTCGIYECVVCVTHGVCVHVGVCSMCGMCVACRMYECVWYVWSVALCVCNMCTGSAVRHLCRQAQPLTF